MKLFRNNIPRTVSVTPLPLVNKDTANSFQMNMENCYENNSNKHLISDVVANVKSQACSVEMNPNQHHHPHHHQNVYPTPNSTDEPFKTGRLNYRSMIELSHACSDKDIKTVDSSNSNNHLMEVANSSIPDPSVAASVADPAFSSFSSHHYDTGVVPLQPHQSVISNSSCLETLLAGDNNILNNHQSQRNIQRMQDRKPIRKLGPKPTPSELNIRDMSQRKRYINLCSNLLSTVVTANDRFAASRSPISRFHSQCVPSISIHRYLERIANYAACSNETLIYSLILIDRLLQCDPSIVLNSLNVHRLVITSVLIAGKFNDDCYFNNVHYGKVGGVSHDEINQLEKEFLRVTNFNLNVQALDFKRFRWLLENVMILHNSGQEGIITEAPCEIDCLFRLFDFFPN